jgi:hypothetical protein
MKRTPSRETEGAGNAGRSSHPQPCVQLEKHASKSPQVRRNDPAFPAQWFYGLSRALPGVPGFVATVARQSSSANLIPAAGNQDHTVLPSASGAPVQRANASITSLPTFPDDREAPLMRAGRAKRNH